MPRRFSGGRVALDQVPEDHEDVAHGGLVMERCELEAQHLVTLRGDGVPHRGRDDAPLERALPRAHQLPVHLCAHLDRGPVDVDDGESVVGVGAPECLEPLAESEGRLQKPLALKVPLSGVEVEGRLRTRQAGSTDRACEHERVRVLGQVQNAELLVGLACAADESAGRIERLAQLAGVDDVVLRVVQPKVLDDAAATISEGLFRVGVAAKNAAAM
mmetsp:Transcript_35851/g.99376  ORF Transcript_35851/g.99376 Transcript_35851/m.99376 type:complete len:216 (+) Transcript_35851:87-734(+)